MQRFRISSFRKSLFQVAVGVVFAVSVARADIRLSDFEYPFPTEIYAFQSQGWEQEMVYMDVSPEDIDDAPVVVLLHGKNFSGAYFETTANALVEAGYRVIMPDQLGFGKSSKPAFYHYTFQQLAENTRALLRELEVEHAHILGHSMGGMQATRFVLMYPEFSDSLVLVNPIGLEDWKALGVPYQTVDEWYAGELRKTGEKVRAYMLESYYDNQWEPEYDRWVEMLEHFIEAENYPVMAWNQALTYDMIYTQPVYYEFKDVSVPTLMIIGQRDRTALGKNLVSPELRAELGRYERLDEEVAALIPDAELVELEGIGHMPHIEAFDRFIAPLRSFLQDQSAGD
jgi:pimeloyl-ACP methyl ester carboxylesterase